MGGQAEQRDEPTIQRTLVLALFCLGSGWLASSARSQPLAGPASAARLQEWGIIEIVDLEPTTPDPTRSWSLGLADLQETASSTDTPGPTEASGGEDGAAEGEAAQLGGSAAGLGEGVEPPKPPNPCDADLQRNPALIDKARGAAFEVVCQSARWFDHFFGDESYWRSASRLHGRLGLMLVGDQHDGLDVDTTFHAEVDLPNLENKVNVFLRRDDEQDYVSVYDPEIELIPEFRRFESQRRWLLGAGYHPMGGASKGLDLDLGVELGSPLEPLARARYRHYWMLGERSMLRTRQSVYWTNIRGLGTAVAVNVDRPFGDDLLLRFSGGGDLNEITEGVAWKSSLSLFQMVNEDRAFVYRVGVQGETDAHYPVEEWIGEVRFRQRMIREWFVGELVVGSSWVHETLGSPREAGLYVGVGFEISFDRGDAYSPSRRSSPAPSQ